jgi:hypothetical protein
VFVREGEPCLLADSNFDDDNNNSLLEAAMRFTVKPSQFDCSVPISELDEAATSADRTPVDDGHPNGNYLSTSTTTDERKSLLSRSCPYATAEAAVIDSSDEETSKSACGFSDDDGGGDDDLGQQSTMSPRELRVDGQETGSKAESCAAGTVSTMHASNGAVVPSSLAHRGRKFAARQKRRLVFKDGNCNITSRNVMSRKRKYLVDIFTTMVDMRWRYNVVMFTAAFVLSWLAFSVIWFLIAYLHGDTEHADEDGWKPCAAHVYDFPTALLFSIESQTTIGYG